MALRLNSQFCSQIAKQVPWGRKDRKFAATSYNVYVSQNQTCKASSIKINDRRTTVHKPIEIERRSANYKPNIWEHDFIQTLNNEYSGEVHDIKENIDTNLAELVNHALDLPLNLRITRVEAKWYIDALSRKAGVNSNLLELAKLDYNIVQAAHQKDVIDMSRWWKNLGLPKKLPFARNRLVECFLWSVGVAYEPQYSYLRQELTKLVILLTTIDDIYDIYATFEEAELFSDAVERWDVSAVEQLPDYMKLCFLALYNTINEIAYDTLKEHGLNIIPCLRKTLVAQFKSFKLEAKWFHTGYKPTLQEYLDNACISLGGPLVLVHSYFLMRPEITKEALEYIESYPSLIRLTSMILRLADDLGTSKAEVERGDVPKSIQCYMHENDVNEEVARKYIRHLTDETWKKMNAELLVDSPVPQAFVKFAVNWIRTAETTYQNEDGHGVPDKETKTRVLSLLVDPIPIA
ncbi:Myrcene synthase protein [Thalictrum thalictroides]|uniref:Myrcene synthase protein n=1 Tax=Thalictrum thalictroides TaxID=46969 RepID=A0A7J6VX53_THATH|nr:Myrcene synthase protein [Thalictrum thalictroides]